MDTGFVGVIGFVLLDDEPRAARHGVGLRTETGEPHNLGLEVLREGVYTKRATVEVDVVVERRKQGANHITINRLNCSPVEHDCTRLDTRNEVVDVDCRIDERGKSQEFSHVVQTAS